MKPRIGILGGSFDPIHRGHIWFAEQALSDKLVDQIYIVPAHHNPLKQTGPTATDTQRLSMCKLGCAASAFASKLSVLDVELQRTGMSYMFDTLTFLSRAEQAEWSLLLGLDTAKDLDRWHRAAELLSMVDLVISPRYVQSDSSNSGPLEIISQVLHRLNIVHTVHSAKLITWSGHSARMTGGAAPEISSTQVRHELASGPAQCPEALTPGVFKFIQENRCYADN